jgi:hypothetical protein
MQYPELISKKVSSKLKERFGPHRKMDGRGVLYSMACKRHPFQVAKVIFRPLEAEFMAIFSRTRDSRFVIFGLFT